LTSAASDSNLLLHHSAALKEEWDREKAALYSQLDEKDDEINAQSQELEKLGQQMNESEELINQLRKENDDLQMRIASLENDNESQKDEVKEVLKALEELAMNFDQKQQEAETKSKENETLTLELDKKLSNLKVIEDELENLKEVAQNQRKRLLDMMVTLLKDLGEIGNIIGGNMNNSEFKVCFALFAYTKKMFIRSESKTKRRFVRKNKVFY
jgi:kinesin family protein 5